jgi:large subunit ribosomal protein L24e
MSKCSFCGKNIEKGSGKMFVENNGKIYHFCSSKCEKNLLKLRRDPRDFKWAREKK